jgi:hypothetical protein
MMLPRSWPMARRGRLWGLPRDLSLLGMQAAEEFLHLRRDIGMVMYDGVSPSTHLLRELNRRYHTQQDDEALCREKSPNVSCGAGSARAASP